MAAFDFNFKLAPQKAQEYLNNKGFKLSFNYDEMEKSANHTSFTVAKVTRIDLLNDIFTSLAEAQASGEVFNDWKKRIKPTLQKKGWWGAQEITNPKTGKVKTVYIGARRLRTIFNTNMRVAYSVKRHHSLRQLTKAVYWRYSSMFLPHSRHDHKAIDGTLLHRDHDFWKSNTPPNGWNCKCKIRAYSQKDAKRKAMTIAKNAPPSVADKDWAYDIGKGSQVAKLAPLKLGNGLELLKHSPRLENLSKAQLTDRFYKTIGTKKGELHIDRAGDPMVIDDELFNKANLKTHHVSLDAFAKTLNDPDEIYIEVMNQQGKEILHKKMVRYFQDADGQTSAVVPRFSFQADKTIATSLEVIGGKAISTEIAKAKPTRKLIYQKNQG